MLLVTVAVLQLSSCGYILHPERRGQTSGRIDAGIAVLDACGLLFFIIPGVVAFAVDFASGAIYLPPGEARVLPPSFAEAESVVVRMDPEYMYRAAVESVVASHVGEPVDLASDDIRVYEVDESGRFIQRDPAQLIPFRSSGS